MNPETRAAGMVADLMVLSARTAPKGKGTDSVTAVVKTGNELAILSDEMKRIGERDGVGFFIRDAGNVTSADACVILGCAGGTILGLNCGGCGYATCKEMADAWTERDQNQPFSGPNCVIKMADLGIAVGSAVKTASIHNLDNRIMYSAGVAALSLGWLEGCSVAYAIPVRAAGKNIFFDRKA
ncbi:DUF2148 domain-containing protein [Methanogenium sp. S4BF]|uniref:ferredoxin domain-containing protein n=1 Tax=Methanogenium sp. S4BF TaxID=1789226 RepID=UPI00241664F5|nr:DUF2148 domain-containing protein [Methanogenium sp. S4BF]WFN35153.1 DUF2148 domain-containing protein [Methanogenium sp. S4BF]